MLKILELFGGIGACSKALDKLGIDYEIVDYVEIDKYAVKSFNAIHNTNFEPQDITTWDKDIEVDLIMHGSPCQDFSLAGKQAGGDKDSGTRSSLMYETIRIVEKLKPKYVIWENVKNLLSKKHRHNFDAYLERMNQLGYTNYYQVLNAKDYGIPQNRERVFTISIRKDINKVFTFPPKQELKLKLKDILESEVDEKYYLSNSQIEYLEYGKYNASKVSNKIKQTDTGICPTLDTMQGGNRQPFIRVKNATKKGYLEAYEGDGVNISSRMKYQRGNVQKESIQTITTSGGNDRGVVVSDKPRKDIKELEKYCEYCGKQLERKRFNGRLEDFTVFKNRKYCNRECMRKDWVKIGDNHNQSYSNAHTTARKINELILHKELCELCGSDTNLDIHHIDGNWQNNNLDNLMCLCRSCHTKYERNKDKNELRIRKLTPLEVWRLMGFDDEDFEKASKVNSNTQLYKQAGNSIVVNVLESIFKELIK
ncbi:MAG: DNA (cytosine-5-)-methyltransferase [Clostridium sp.]|nr:DNA (cytosine-5-)-methyltransferase [Clostridium sp.]